MSLTDSLVRPLRRRLPGRLELAGPALRASAALGVATSDAITRAVIADLGISKRASLSRTNRTDSRSYVFHEAAFALTLMATARLLRVLDGQGWEITDDGERLVAEQVSDQEVAEILRASRRKKKVAIDEPIVGLRELPIPPRGVTDDPTVCTYAIQSISGGDIKLGRSTLGRVWERTNENDSRGEPLRITRIFAGGRPTERALHRYFADLRRRSNREWFRAAPELALLVYAIPEAPSAQEAA
jgi:hypothetical protein